MNRCRPKQAWQDTLKEDNAKLQISWSDAKEVTATVLNKETSLPTVPALIGKTKSNSK